VVHYGTSTGFFAKKMFEQGPEYLSAAVMYENNVIQSYNSKTPLPVVAVYPREGTFWSDHPAAIVNREWVTKEHEAAAKAYVEFLTAEESQKVAMDWGFRPGDPAIALTSRFGKDFGVDGAEPKTTLEVPTPPVLQGVIDVWEKNKKPANVVIVFDTSGSMKEEDRMAHAKAGAADLAGMLHDNDLVTFIPFSTSPNVRMASAPVGLSRDKLVNGEIAGVFPSGGTALYDAVLAAHAYLTANPKPGYINAVVVMTDGQDTDSKMVNLESLVTQIRPVRSAESGKDNGIRVFTIGYGDGAKMDVLKRISEATDAKEFRGTNENIRAVFKEIATFF
jgi:Ca-activated chloride channel family protein